MASLLTVFPNGAALGGVPVNGFTVTSVTANSNQTYSASAVLNGMVLRNPNGADRTDTLPTAASVLALWTEQCNGHAPPVGAWFYFCVSNTATADYRLILAPGTGWTVGTPVVAPGDTRAWMCVRTGSAALTAVPVGPIFSDESRNFVTVATISTAGNVTYTVDQVLGGIIRRDCNGGNRTDTTPTAAALIAGLANYTGRVTVGTTLRFIIYNVSAAAYTVTVSAGTGVTIVGTNTIGQNNCREFVLVVTNVTSGSEAVSLYSLGAATY